MNVRFPAPSRGTVYGGLGSVAAVVVVAGAIALLKAHVPLLSLGVQFAAEQRN